jgi:regulatory factor X 1/2/3
LLFKASWAYECDDGLIRQLEAVFKLTAQQHSLEELTALLKSVIEQVLKPYEGKSNFSKAAKEFLLKWSFFR